MVPCSNLQNMANFPELCEQLEKQEIESPGGVAEPQVYAQLLALYLLKNDLTNAKFLWKRIPPSIKSSNAELGQVWDVGQKVWQRDFPAIYEGLQREWSDPLKPLMAGLAEATKKRAFLLVQRAYSSISADDLAAFLGMSVNQAVDAVVAEGWTADAQTRMVVPKKAEIPKQASVPSEQQLARLTDFVAFLEN